MLQSMHSDNSDHVFQDKACYKHASLMNAAFSLLCKFHYMSACVFKRSRMNFTMETLPMPNVFWTQSVLTGLCFPVIWHIAKVVLYWEVPRPVVQTEKSKFERKIQNNVTVTK